MTLPPMTNETLQWLTLLPVSMQNHSWSNTVALEIDFFSPHPLQFAVLLSVSTETSAEEGEQNDTDPASAYMKQLDQLQKSVIVILGILKNITPIISTTVLAVS